MIPERCCDGFEAEHGEPSEECTRNAAAPETGPTPVSGAGSGTQRTTPLFEGLQ